MVGKTLLLVLCMATMLSAASEQMRLVDAVQNGDAEAVRVLLKQKVDVNAPQGDGMTALHWAAFNDDVVSAQLLIAAGANLKAATRAGAITPLLIASAQGNAFIVEAMLKAGADANSATADGATALMKAAISGDADAVTVLLNHGADPNATDSAHHTTALMFAAAENRPAAIRALVAHGADTKATTVVVPLEDVKLDDNGNPIPANGGRLASAGTVTGGNTVMGGMTALLFAARNGHLDAVRALLDGHASVNQLSAGDHSSPLVIAISNGHYDVGQLLLDRGADPNLANVDGLTPLYATIDMQYAPVSWAPNPLITQETVSHLDLMRALLAHGADPNAQLARRLWFRPTSHNQQWVTTTRTTAFWRAAQGTDVPAMRLLVEFGADPKMPSAEGTTALMVAAGLGFNGNFSQHAPDSWVAAVSYCLELGLDLNAADNHGYTALHGAAYRGDNELVRFLVDKGARLNARNARGWSVTDMANAPSLRSSVPLAHPKTVALLIQLGAPALTQIEGETILGAGRPRAATPKPHSEVEGYASWMKGIAVVSESLNKNVEERQSAESSKNGEQLAALFTQVETFWATTDRSDAADLAKAAQTASLDLASAATTGNWDQAAIALRAINVTCGSCHRVHRERLPNGAFAIKR